MKSAQITASFFQVLNNQPELFTQETQQDLTQLEIAIDRVEYIPEDDQTEFLANAIIDFCDVNPTIHKALNQNLNLSPTPDSPKITEEKRFLLSQKIRSLLT
ncbi:hypothetical protein [Lyngbya sp. PCC 8106]|uniref:hypothetical protein n=1 Tax=Lyngbya sp. (strain PCC 8106) TaxID=313612 RepID=UPI0000EAC7D0|nr:hypothetical protein [Lyngbya sp. PCC 8106]EAW38738.1 hypothetical protein L8106_15025 [Lyngbya sp. PCC 8106]